MKIQTVKVYLKLGRFVCYGEFQGKETFKTGTVKSLQVDTNFHFILNGVKEYILVLVNFTLADEEYTFLPLNW